MRTARLLLLIVYAAGHIGLPLPLPAGACGPAMCGCGAACQCAQEKIAAGNCCCSAHAGPTKAPGRSCCSATIGTVCSDSGEKSGSDEDLCGTGTEAADAASTTTAKPRACCGGAKSEAGSDDECAVPPVSPVLRACGCQQDAPEGIAVCSDPRVPPSRTTPPCLCCCGRLSPAGSASPAQVVQSPDDPVPRRIA